MQISAGIQQRAPLFASPSNMADLIKGCVTLPKGYQICPSTTENGFISSNDGASAKLVVKNDGYTSYKIIHAPFFGQNVTVTLFFYDDKIAQAQLYFDLGVSNAVDEAAYIKQWITQKLGEPPYVYDWGQISVLSDPKSDFSALAIQYEK